MKFGLVTFGIFALCLAISEASYGGKYARNGQFPYVGLITYGGAKRCGASIIHERWALTAARCLHGLWGKLRLTVGTSKNYLSGVNYEFEAFFPHNDSIVVAEEDNEGLEFVNNDIGLIRLAKNITYNDKVQPIKLETDENKSYANSMATLPGWGAAEFDEGMHNQLRYIKVRVLTEEECESVWTYADKHVCTSTKERQGVCYGDAGSPLVVGDTQIGIAVTTDRYCKSLKPDLYTKVASFIPWIKGIMSRYGDVLPESGVAKPCTCV